MKKRSLFIVVAMVLLLAVVLGMGGTTFAKYISTASIPAANATVAQWGFVVTADGDLFGTKYNADGAIANDGTAVVSYTASGNGEIVAPGTKGSFNIAINGKAEVLSKLTIDVADTSTITLLKNKAGEDVTTTSKSLTDGTEITAYEPVKWTITNNDTATTVTNGTLYDVVTYLEGLTATVAAGQELTYNLVISWDWAFEGGQDAYDTALGALAAKAAGDATNEAGSATGTNTIGLSVSIQLAQIEPDRMA